MFSVFDKMLVETLHSRDVADMTSSEGQFQMWDCMPICVSYPVRSLDDLVVSGEVL